MIWNERFPREVQPTLADIRAFIASPLWEDFCGTIERTYGAQPVIEHSRCSGAPGWNVKYKKSGRSLCTLYPAAGYFTCLAAIGGEAATEAELRLDAYGSRIATLYRNAKPMNGARWLMIDVRDAETLNGTLALVALRATRR
jgi:hypothetical protein